VKKKLAALLTLACAFVLALALAGCQNKAPDETAVAPEPEPVDTVDRAATTFPMKPFYCLIVGNDSRDGTKDEGKGKHGSDGHQRSDTMMLMRVAPKDHLITIVSIARDTWTVMDGQNKKVNMWYDRGGIEGSVAKVEELTGVNIKYYFDVSFSEFTKLVDALGGVDVDVPVEMSFRNVMDGKTITLQPGAQTLNGDEALVFARVRKIFVNMDSSRQYDDRQIVQSLMQKAIDNPEQLAQYTGDFMNIVHTNMPDEALVFYLSDFIEHSDDVKFLSGSFPIEGDIDPESGWWLAWYDADTWKAIVDVIDKGGDPNEVYSPPAYG